MRSHADQQKPVVDTADELTYWEPKKTHPVTAKRLQHMRSGGGPATVGGAGGAQGGPPVRGDGGHAACRQLRSRAEL